MKLSIAAIASLFLVTTSSPLVLASKTENEGADANVSRVRRTKSSLTLLTNPTSQGAFGTINYFENGATEPVDLLTTFPSQGLGSRLVLSGVPLGETYSFEDANLFDVTDIVGSFSGACTFVDTSTSAFCNLQITMDDSEQSTIALTGYFPCAICGEDERALTIVGGSGLFKNAAGFVESEFIIAGINMIEFTLNFE